MQRRKKHAMMLLSLLFTGLVGVNVLGMHNSQLFAWCTMEQINTTTLKTEQLPVACGPLVADELSWVGWLQGSSSTQFHYIDLLELITPSQKS